jgi:hypothetical protein
MITLDSSTTNVKENNNLTGISCASHFSSRLSDEEAMRRRTWIIAWPFRC